MRRFLSGIAVTAVLMCTLVGTASAHGGHHRAVRQCDSTACTVNGVSDGSCSGTGSCLNYDGCNHTSTTVRTVHHAHRGHH